MKTDESTNQKRDSLRIVGKRAVEGRPIAVMDRANDTSIKDRRITENIMTKKEATILFTNNLEEIMMLVMEQGIPTTRMIPAVMRVGEAVDRPHEEMTGARETMMMTLGETDEEEATTPEEGEASPAKESTIYNVI